MKAHIISIERTKSNTYWVDYFDGLKKKSVECYYMSKKASLAFTRELAFIDRNPKGIKIKDMGMTGRKSLSESY